MTDTSPTPTTTAATVDTATATTTTTSTAAASDTPSTTSSTSTETITTSDTTASAATTSSPIVFVNSPQTAYIGEAFSWTPDLIGGDGSPIKISLTDGMIPKGMTIVDGVIAGIPSDDASYKFQLTATDGQFTISENYTITPVKRVTPTLDETLVGMDLTFYIAEKSYEVEASLLKGLGSTQLTNILVNMTRLLLADPTAYKLQAMLDFHKKYATTSLAETQAFIDAPLAVKSVRSVYTAYRSIAVGPRLSSYDFIVADTGSTELAAFIKAQ